MNDADRLQNVAKEMECLVSLAVRAFWIDAVK